MQSLLEEFTYTALVFLLVGGGMGLPVPEDIPLITAGYLCAQGRIVLWFTIALSLASIIIADQLLYWLGRRYGDQLPNTRWVGHWLTETRLKAISIRYQEHGGKILLMARFMPGIRALFFLAAGACGLPLWKMLVYDGLAALVSVPVMILLGFAFADHIDTVIHWERHAIFVLLISIGLSALAIWGLRTLTRRFDART